MNELTYYDRPVLKQPVWIWAVPLYFYVGGLSGASMTLGAAAQIADPDELAGFIRRCRLTGGIGGGIGTALLIYDLGRPSRFLNMLRVFRPTSPMNVGAWVLAGAAPIAMGAALWSHKQGFRGDLANVAGLIAGLLGLPLAGYTAVLLSNSAIPVWHDARRTLPFLFIGSAMTSAASFFELIRNSPRECRLIATFGTAGRVLELASTVAIEREANKVARPMHDGASGAIIKTATVLTAASLIASLWPKQSRKTRVAAGVLGTLGSIALRYGVYYAGRASAQDPRATFVPQRQRLEAGLQ